jgi:periplasmic protein TonB
MFEDSLLESGGKLKDKRGRYTGVAFLIEALILGVALLIPLYYTEELPAAQLVTFLVAPPPPPPPPPPAAPAKVVKVVKVQTDIEDGKLKTPTKIPDKIQKIVEDVPPPPVSSVSGVVGGVPGGIPGGTPGGVIGGIISSTPPAIPHLAPPTVVRVSSGVSAGLLVHKVNPEYPPLARQARVQGTVLLEAVIGKDGTIENLKVVSGHPMLVGSAVNAVKQWRYRPYLLNGEPVEVQTQVQVNFRLDGGN